jgi:SAM-dependent methyltransferase
LSSVGHHKRVLEIGAHDGHFSRLLLAQGCTVTAVEISPDAAEVARTIVPDVRCGNFEDESFRNTIQDVFDVVLFMHVLEHFRDPWEALRNSHRFLKPDGFMIILLPNVACWQVRKELFFKGCFEYQDSGILDRTHLRFFTLRSGFELIHKSGYAVINWEPADIYIPLESRIAYFVSKSLANRWRHWMVRRFPNLCSQVILFRVQPVR